MAAIEIRVPPPVDQMDELTLTTRDCTGCNLTLFNTTQLTNDSSEMSIINDRLGELNVAEKYAFLLWYVIGLPANSLAFVVWIQSQGSFFCGTCEKKSGIPHMINSSGCYMAALAFTDNIFLILHFTVHISRWVEDANPLGHPVVCQMLPTLYTAVQYLSGLLVLQFTVEQYIAICHPFKRSRYCRVSIAKKVIVGGIAFVMLLGAPQAYFFKLEYNNELQRYECDVRPSLLEGAITSIWSIWTWVIEMIMFGAVPISCLALNIRVIYEVMRQAKTQLVRHYSSRSTKSSSQQARKHGTTTVMLLAVSLYWVCTEIPATVVLGLSEKYQQPNVADIDEATWTEAFNTYINYKTTRTIIDIISFSRYSCKLFIYLATGKQFRKHVRFFRSRQRLNRQASDTTMTSVARTLSYRRNKEESRRSGAMYEIECKAKFFPSESSYSKLCLSQPNSPTGESWGDDVAVDTKTLTGLHSETSIIVNDDDDQKFP